MSCCFRSSCIFYHITYLWVDIHPYQGILGRESSSYLWAMLLPHIPSTLGLPSVLRSYHFFHILDIPDIANITEQWIAIYFF